MLVPVLRGAVRVGYSHAHRARAGGAVFLADHGLHILALCSGNWLGSPQEPSFCFLFCNVNYRQMVWMAEGVGWPWVLSGKFCPLLRGTGCSLPHSSYHSSLKAQAWRLKPDFPLSVQEIILHALTRARRRPFLKEVTSTSALVLR